MAIYHLNAKIISRGKGQSAIAAAAYRSGDRLNDEQAAEQKTYQTRAGRILHTEIMAPSDAPAWARDRNQLWNEAERAEKRKDAQLAREFEVSLPHELTAEQRQWLIKDFAREQFVRKGYAVDIAIHAPDRSSDGRNFHAHLMVTMRTLGPEGFAAKKDRSLNSDAQLDSWRQNWAHLANRHLERHGHEARIDHRSLDAQGVDREATTHVGYAAAEMKKRGARSDKVDALNEVHLRNGLRADLKETDREIAQLEAQLAAKTMAERKLTEAARADDQKLRDPKPGTWSAERDFADGARKAAGEIRQERREERAEARQEAWREQARREMPRQGGAQTAGAGGIKVVDGATGVVSSLADFMLDLFAGSSAPDEGRRPMDIKDYVNDPRARSEHQLARLQAMQEAEADRKAVDNIRRDLEAGRSLKAEDIRNLTHTHQEQIRLKGDDGARELVDSARRYAEQYWKGNERER